MQPWQPKRFFKGYLLIHWYWSGTRSDLQGRGSRYGKESVTPPLGCEGDVHERAEGRF